MRIYIGHVFIYSEKYICVITEIRKVKMVDNVKNNKIISKENKLLVGFFADIKAMRINCSAFYDQKGFLALQTESRLQKYFSIGINCMSF